MGVVENKLRKLQISQNEILHITSFTCVFSIPVKSPLNIKITQFPVGFHVNNSR